MFIIYISDIDVGIVSRIAKLVDDMKLGAKVANSGSVEIFRSDLEKMGERFEKWLMPFSSDKCKVMHIGHTNQNADYSLLNQDMVSSDLETDLDVLISTDLKFSKQCIEVEKKAQELFGLHRKTVSIP